MAGFNKAILLGNLGKDPEIRRLDDGRAVANFSIATSESYKNKAGERVTNTEWHNIVLWSPLAEIAENYLKKGSQVYIEGKISNRSYEDKDGVKKYISEVVGREISLPIIFARSKDCWEGWVYSCRQAYHLQNFHEVFVTGFKLHTSQV